MGGGGKECKSPGLAMNFKSLPPLRVTRQLAAARARRESIARGGQIVYVPRMRYGSHRFISRSMRTYRTTIIDFRLRFAVETIVPPL